MNGEQNKHFPLRTTLSIGARPAEQRVIQLDEPTTYFSTLPLESGATALRVGLMNTTDLPFPVEGICVCETAEQWGSGESGWAYFGFSGTAGMRPAGGPRRVMVPRCTRHEATGARDVPVIVWSDWMTFETRSEGRPQLQLRTHIATKTAILGFCGLPRPALNGQPERRRAQAAAAGDFVTQPDQNLPAVEPSPYTPIAVVQYQSARPGLQIVIGGDSHLARSQIFPQLVADQLSTPEQPICTWNTAREARNSNTFWPALNEAIDLGQPSVAVIQGWTANDGMTPEKDEAYLLRVTQSAERVLALGGVPLIVKGMPRELAGKAALRSWQEINRKIDTLIDGAMIFDPVPIVENPKAPGNWLGRYADDAIHPNAAANLAMRDPFKTLLLSRYQR